MVSPLCTSGLGPTAVTRLAYDHLETTQKGVMTSNRYYAVNKISGKIAVLADDEGRQVALPLARLPKAVAPGSVLSIRLDKAGTPAWSSAEIDEEEARRRAAETARLKEGQAERKRSEGPSD